MSVLIEDSPRANLDGWIIERHLAGCCAGTVVSPFATPWDHRPGPGRKASAGRRISDLQAAGVAVWFDPMTHALQMSGVGDFRYYDQYDLWNPERPGELDTRDDRADHVRRVFAVQEELHVRALAPTVLLHTGLSDTSALALDLAREALEQNDECWLTVAGTTSFWSSGAALDAHLGALAGLEPQGWFLVPVKPLTTWPVEPDAGEVHGLCRAARALSEDAPVHISHGDLAGLPAVAAGASTVGTGWDRRQRVCSIADYAFRGEGGDGGGWLGRVTLSGLLGAVSANEADILSTREPDFIAALGGLPAPGPRERFMAHVDALAGVANELTAITDSQNRYQHLIELYRSAATHWPAVQQVTACGAGADRWIDVFAEGLAAYGQSEGYRS